MTHGACKGISWTPAEDALLLRLAPTLRADELTAHLPDRSISAIFHRWRRLGIDKRRRWTKADDANLEALWGAPLATVARQLKRTKITTYWRAQKLGLGLGCPAGYEYLSAAARRCGYCASQLRMILRWARVAIRKSVTREKSKRTFHWVDPLSVDDAVAAWHATESPHGAARRRGTTTDKLIGRLLASGLPLPEKPRGKCHWRIPSATIDRALAMVEKRGRHLVVVREQIHAIQSRKKHPTTQIQEAALQHRRQRNCTKQRPRRSCCATTAERGSRSYAPTWREPRTSCFARRPSTSESRRWSSRPTRRS